tara:strand:- start:52 stop:501 length:450 start_codon:yes stop_codon:yes gene_type:complete
MTSMNISKKEIYIFIDIVFSIMFAIIYLPFFYKNSINPLTNSEAISKVIQVIIFSGVYFSVTYGLLQLLFKEKIIKDERDYLINSKAYKLSYLIYNICLFWIIGHYLDGDSFINNGFEFDDSIIFILLIVITGVSIVKSSYQLYLYRTA